jgi:hypothetical protein
MTMAGRDLAVSFVDGVTDTDPKPRTLAWPKLAARLVDFRLRPDLAPPVSKDVRKRSLPAIIPATFTGPGRERAHVAAVNVAFLDFDGTCDISTARARWAGFAYALHTSWSHTAEKHRFRLVLPLARPVPRDAWPDAFARLVELAVEPFDRCSENPAQPFFLPAVPSSTAERFGVVNDGPWLDLLAELDKRTPPAPPALAPAPRDAAKRSQTPGHRPALWDDLAGVDLEAVALAAGLQRLGSGWGPCPECGADRRGSEKKRGPLRFWRADRGPAWTCLVCKATGDGAQLLRLAAGGDLARARELAEGAGLLPPVVADVPAVSRNRPVDASKPPPAMDARPAAPAALQAPRAPAGDAGPLAWWSGLPRVGEPTAAGLVAWLDELGTNQEAVRALELARGWPTWADPSVASWATWRRSSWTEAGCLAVLPTFGPAGLQAGIRAVFPGGEAAPRGTSSAGTVFADPVGRWLLAAGGQAKAGGQVDGWRWRWSGRVVVVAGAAGWLQAVTAGGRLTRENTAAVFGVWSGGWTRAIGARIPPGAELVMVDLGADLEAVVRGSVEPGVEVKRVRS